MALAARGDSPVFAGDAAALLGDVLLAAKRPSEAREQYAEALVRYEQKDATALAATARAALDRVGGRVARPMTLDRRS